MNSIKIVSIPPGESPLWVRQQLVGLEFPLIIEDGIVSVDHEGNFLIDKHAIIATLRSVFPKAARWINENSDGQLSPGIIFPKQDCIEM